MESSASSAGSSFVLVDSLAAGGSAQLDTALLSTLSPYFPSINDPAAFSWDYERTQEVKQTRDQQPDGKLFIDELLSLLNIDGPSEYPPSSASSFNALLYRLLSSPSSLQAHCIIFYLLLASPSSHSPSPLPTKFARTFLLPTGFVRGIQGFHALDAGNYRAAVSALTDPHLTPDFVPKTFAVLASMPSVKERAGLVLSFWRLSGVGLDSVNEAEIVIGALCDQERKFGVAEAWSLQRQWPEEEERDQLAVKVLSTCFGDNAVTTPVPHHLQSLLSHHFSPAEDALVDNFCLAPPSSFISPTLTADWRLSKLIAESRALDALRFWAKAKRSKGVKGSDERERLLRAVHATLTEVQRNELALEADDFTPSAPITSASRPQADITQPAWAPIPTPAPTTTSATPSRARLIAPPRPSPAKPLQPQAADLPLSASPFLRREKPLVGSSDGTQLGGAQKSVLRALREGIAPATPEKGKQRQAELALPGSPFAQHDQSPGPRSFGTPRAGSVFSQQQDSSYPSPSPVRKPTLSGFGSVRLPQVQSYGKARDEGQSLFAPVGGKERWDSEGPSEAGMDMDVEQEEQQEPSAVPRHEELVDEEFSFGVRAAQDPKIAATIAAATSSKTSPLAASQSKPSTSTTRTSSASHGPSTKRRSRNSGASATEKRRAVSTEPEERRPTSSVSLKSNGQSVNSKPPGAFPSTTDDEQDHDEEDSAPVTASARDSRTSTRRSARASSVSAQGEGAPSTPRAAKSTGSKSKKSSAAPAEEQTPKPTRRSSRLRTPAKDDDYVTFDEIGPASRRKTAARGGRGRIEEEEEE